MALKCKNCSCEIDENGSCEGCSFSLKQKTVSERKEVNIDFSVINCSLWNINQFNIYHQNFSSSESL